MRKTFVTALVLAASALAGAGLAAAKAPQPDEDSPPPMMAHMRDGHMGRPGFGHHRPGEHIEGRLAFLKTELAITGAQEKVWGDFATAARKSAKIMQEAMGTPEDRPRALPVPARLDRGEKLLTARLEALKTVEGPTKTLYDALSDTQKKSADELLHHRFGML